MEIQNVTILKDVLKALMPIIQRNRHRAALTDMKADFESRMRQDFDIDLSHKLEAVDILLNDLRAGDDKR